MAFSLSPLVLDNSPIECINLSPLSLPGTGVTEGIRLAPLGLTEATAQLYSITPTGGVVLAGEAPRSFVLNGSAVFDGATYTITPTGGVQISGTRSEQFTYAHVGSGGVIVSGTATVTSVSTAVAGDVAVALPLLSTSFAVQNDPIIALSAKLPVLSASLSSFATQLGSIGTSLPVLGASISATTGNAGGIDARLPALTASFTAALGAAGSISTSLPVIAASVSAYTAVYGSVSVRLPRHVPYIVGTRATLGDQLVMVTNLLSKAVSNYENYPFNSFAKIGDSYYAAGPNGFYKLEEEAANDSEGVALTPVAALFRFGQLSFGSEQQKRVSDCYAAMRSDGDMTLRVYVDEQDPIEYTISPHDVSRLKQRRSLIGKGARGKYWQLEIQNNDGADFDFDTINIAAVPMSRRI